LNFNGRVLQPSKKNFQLILEGSDSNNSNNVNNSNNALNDGSNSNIILQFGKRKKNVYALDFTYPINAIQAFGICLSTLAGKLASE
jgi:tubby-related protein 1